MYLLKSYENNICVDSILVVLAMDRLSPAHAFKTPGDQDPGQVSTILAAAGDDDGGSGLQNVLLLLCELCERVEGGLWRVRMWMYLDRISREREEFFIHRSCSSLCHDLLCSVLWASIVGKICFGGCGGRVVPWW